MTDAAARALLERYWALVSARDTGPAIAELITDDFVEDWPQSNERLHGVDGWRRVVGEHPAYPAVSLRRIGGCGDVWACEADFDYPGADGPWRICSLIELRSGRICRITQYFGAPFEAAAWRAAITERI